MTENETLKARLKDMGERFYEQMSFGDVMLDFVNKSESYLPVKEFLSQALEGIEDNVLDIGSGRMPSTYLPEGTNYVLLDWATRPISGGPILAESIPMKGDAEQLPFSNNSFRAVLSKQVYGYLPNAEQLIKEMARVLKPGGLYILIDGESDRGVAGNFDYRFHDFIPEELKPQLRKLGIEDIQTKRLYSLSSVEISPGVKEDLSLTALAGRKNHSDR